jgi:DNA-binding NtrC family response regulator
MTRFLRPAHFWLLPAAGAARVVSLPLDASDSSDGQEPTRWTIGSGEAADVRIADPEVAEVHATLSATPKGWLLERMALPLLVNGLKVRQHLLTPHDLVSIGKNALSFRPGTPQASEPSAPGSEPTANAAGPRSHSPVALDVVERLHALSQGLEDGQDPRLLAKALLEDVLALTGGARAALVRLAPDHNEAVGFESTEVGDFAVSKAAHLISDSVLARMQDEGRAIRLVDTRLDPVLAGAPSLLANDLTSVLAAPLTQRGTIIGALYVASNARPFSEADEKLVSLFAAHSVHLLGSAEQGRRLRARLSDAQRLASDERAERGGGASSELVGSSVSMQALGARLRRVAAHDIPVLLQGETGTGKEVAARELHRQSARSAGPFVAVHCGAIPAELLASELFGHVRGAFTGAQRDRVGFVRSAEGGTLFLDEIGEMPLQHQVALLRVLQEQTVVPVGAEREVPVDVRIVAASHRPLDEWARDGRFREDLYFRIAGVRLELPALRERGDDVIELSTFFLNKQRQLVKRPDLRFTAAALAALRHAPFPGNVRELFAAVRRAAVLAEDDGITPFDLGLPAVAGSAGPATPGPTDEDDFVRPLVMVRDELVKRYVVEVVARCGGNRTAAADLLKVSVRTVFKYLDEMLGLIVFGCRLLLPFRVGSLDRLFDRV